MRTISRNLLIIVCKQAIFSLWLLPQFLACAAKFGKLGQLLLKFSSQEKPEEKSFKIVYMCPTQFKTMHWWLLLASEWSDRHTIRGNAFKNRGCLDIRMSFCTLILTFLCSLIEGCGFKVARSCYNCCPVLVVESFVVENYWFFT